MDYSNPLLIRPGEVTAATSQLAELADRARRVMEAEAINLTVEASARDEVSQRVAATLNEVHTSFSKASDHGHQQLREVATALRTHANNLVAADEGLPV
ncbi:MAG: PE family protein [Mycobacterium sp.]|nr:PE family protein [Mycobacterium sp.]